MKKLTGILFIALLALALSPALHSAAAGKVVRITLIDENGSGEDGAAQLTDMGDGTTQVQLIMQNAPDGAVQPAHIHTGTCANLNPTPAYPLTNVVDGKSTTVVKVTLDELTKEKYAINVHKSATEAAVYISCGNIPLAITTSGPLTVAQALDLLLSDANDLLATVQKHETDGSLASLDSYHTTFAANEDTIKAKDAATQATLDADMTAVQTALSGSDWDKSEAAAQKLVNDIKAAQTALGGTSSTTLASLVTQFQTAANDLVRETGNKDKEGAQAAYDAFSALFTANDSMLKAQNPTLEGNISAPLGEVKDALASGNWTTAAASSKEIQGVISDAMQQTGGRTTAPSSPMAALVTQFQTAAHDLVRETGNKDKDGAQAAYDAFAALFAANDQTLKAQNPSLEGNISAPLGEVKDALASGDWTTAAASSNEIAGVISDAMKEMGITTSTLPTTGNGSLLLALLLLAGGAGGLLVAGGALRRRAAR